jgi:hypothetical protein
MTTRVQKAQAILQEFVALGIPEDVDITVWSLMVDALKDDVARTLRAEQTGVLFVGGPCDGKTRPVAGEPPQVSIPFYPLVMSYLYRRDGGVYRYVKTCCEICGADVSDEKVATIKKVYG